MRLLEMLEPQARKEELIGSFSLLVASAAFLIPYERMKSAHPMYKEGDDDLTKALRSLDHKHKFLSAPFWPSADHGAWRFSRIMKNANDTRNWRDEKGFHPMAERAENSIAGRMAGEVLRVIRKALAHGNIVYLNADCHEEEDTKVEYLGFLSRYEESGDENFKIRSQFQPCRGRMIASSIFAAERSSAQRD